MQHIHLLMLIPLLVCLATSARGQQLYQQGNVRVHYQTEGQHAVDSADVDRNGIVDQIEDIMTQTLAARVMFVEVLGFPDPFATERFKTASFLDIHLRHRDVLKMNGVAFDELQRFNKPNDAKDLHSICFNLATSVKATANLSPAHEYFHLIQYSMTFFKNRWFTEGTARWSERALGVGGLGPARPLDSWPLSDARMKIVSAMAYDASEHFWNPLAERLDRQGTLPDTPALERLRAMKYTDGSPVLKDAELVGWEFIREVLIELGRVDDEAFRVLGYDRWSEENQRSARNDPFIFHAVLEVAKRKEAQ